MRGQKLIISNFRKSLLTPCERIAANFISLGLQKGDCVGIWSPNHPEWIETQFAAAKAGLILVNVNPSYKTDELAYVIEKCQIARIANHSK